jgi:hypothetical protein
MSTCWPITRVAAGARPRVRRKVGDLWGGRPLVWGFNCPACWSSHFSRKWTQSEAFAAARAHTKTPTHLWRALEVAHQ